MEKKMLSTKPKVAVFITGGTILCSKDAKSGKVTPTYNGEDLLNYIPEIYESYEIEGIEFSRLPGSELTLDHGFRLLKSVKEKLEEEDISGVVIVQGTDTIDEIPYLFHLLLDTEKPVVFTGSMKSFHGLYSDIKGNLVGSIQVAGSKHSNGRGILVFFNETIFSAADVNKAHANRIDAFQSFRGPIGTTVKGTVSYFRNIEKEETYKVEKLDAKVPIIKVYAGVDVFLFKKCIEQKVDGIVVEGFGSGNVPSYLVPVIKTALDNNILIIMTTRCFDGEAMGEYDYEGGGEQLEKMNVIFAGSLSSQKARIKLMVLLAAGKSKEEIAAAFSK